MNEWTRLGTFENVIEEFGIKISQRLVFNGKYHNHDFYELEIVLNGKIRTEINGTTHDLSEGSMVLITPSDVHRYIGIDSPAELINLVFIPKNVESYSFVASVLSGESVICKLSGDSKNSILFFIQKMRTESTNPQLLNHRYISLLLSCLMIELKRIKEQKGMQEQEQSKEAVRKAIIFTRTHFKEQITLEDAAKVMNVSPVYASKLFQQSLGYGFKEYLINLRLEYAASLLAYTDESITDISYFAGYNSISYFSRGFKKKYNVSPAEYRKNHR